MKTFTRNSFLGAMMATALLMSVATMAQNKVTGGRRPAGTTTQTTNSASTVSSQAKATNSNVTTKATPSTRTTAVSSNSSQSKVSNTATTTTSRNDNKTTSSTSSGSGTASGRRPAGTTSAASTSGSVTRSSGATHWPSSNSVTVPSTSSSSTNRATSSTSGNRTNIGTSSSTVSSGSSTKSGSGTVSGGRRPTSTSTVAGNISKNNSAISSSARPNEGVGIDSRLNNNTGNNTANAGNISANSGIIRGGSTNIGGGRRPGVDNSNHNAASSHYELTNHRNYSTYNNNYRHNDWSRPLPPPARQYRPAVRIITRPVMPTGFVIYNRAPRINTILGLSFGSYYNSSLNYLFTMGYDIDGYNRDVIYLRDVPMLRFTWADVMLSYDTYGRLYNAQFAHSTSYRDRSRFNRLYHDLYATYGTPVATHITAYEASVTWFGGNAEGYVTLEFGTDTYGRYFTMVTVGY